MRAPPPDDTPGQVEEREARIDADVEREHLGDWARAEREYAEQYGKCVLETSYKFCMMGVKCWTRPEEPPFAQAQTYSTMAPSDQALTVVHKEQVLQMSKVHLQ